MGKSKGSAEGNGQAKGRARGKGREGKGAGGCQGGGGEDTKGRLYEFTKQPRWQQGLLQETTETLVGGVS